MLEPICGPEWDSDIRALTGFALRNLYPEHSVEKRLGFYIPDRVSTQGKEQSDVELDIRTAANPGTVADDNEDDKDSDTEQALVPLTPAYSYPLATSSGIGHRNLHALRRSLARPKVRGVRGISFCLIQ